MGSERGSTAGATVEQNGKTVQEQHQLGLLGTSSQRALFGTPRARSLASVTISRRKDLRYGADAVGSQIGVSRGLTPAILLRRDHKECGRRAQRASHNRSVRRQQQLLVRPNARGNSMEVPQSRRIEIQ